MLKLVAVCVCAAFALLAGATFTSTGWAQGAPKTCSDAFSSCVVETHMNKECDSEKRWCLKTGSFAHPKTKTVTSGLQKR